jgi:ABC-type bacteriocin/lantibiotic exporter with double-glycine peptidase domain
MIPFKAKLRIIVSCLVISIVLNFLQPLFIQRITDEGMNDKNVKIIVYSALILLVLVVINQLIEVLQTKIFIDIHNKSEYLLLKQAFNKLLHIKNEYFEDKNNAEIVNSIQTDVGNVSLITDRFMVINISYLFKVISGIAGLLIISWKLTFVVLLMVPIKYLMVRKLSNLKEKKMEDIIESHRDFSAWFGDNIGGIKEIKLWNLYNQRLTAFEKKQKSIFKINTENTMLDTWNGFFEIMLEWTVTIMLYILGGILIVNNTLTIGGVFAFLSYSSYVTGPISSILNIQYYISRILPSANRLFTFLDMDEDERNGSLGVFEKNIVESYTIQFQNVSFSYESGKEILTDINFSISKGEKIAIIGQNGSGKTTLLNLILRFIEPSSGKIIIGEDNINSINYHEYRSLFSVVSQETYLFYDTILNNINLTGCASEEKMEEACHQSGAFEFINKLPKKVNSMVGKNGARLSGGEKQKIAVARAIIKDSPIVVLDEATSGFDVESDAYLHQVIIDELKDKAVIMITHRYENLAGMDKVYQLKGGKLEQV